MLSFAGSLKALLAVERSNMYEGSGGFPPLVARLLVADPPQTESGGVRVWLTWGNRKQPG